MNFSNTTVNRVKTLTEAPSVELLLVDIAAQMILPVESPALQPWWCHMTGGAKRDWLNLDEPMRASIALAWLTGWD